LLTLLLLLLLLSRVATLVTVPKYEQHHENRAICFAYILQSSKNPNPNPNPNPIPNGNSNTTATTTCHIITQSGNGGNLLLSGRRSQQHLQIQRET